MAIRPTFVPFIFVGSVAFTSCQSRTPSNLGVAERNPVLRTLPAGVPSTAAEAGKSGAVTSTAADDDALLLSELRAVASKQDPRRMFGVTKQLPPPSRSRKIQLASHFPTSFARVVAYERPSPRDVGASRIVPSCDTACEGCDFVSRDGTICKSVFRDGKTLSAEQAQRLAAQLNAPDRSLEHTGNTCGFVPHHGFVFFDAEGNPVAEVDVCFACSEALVVPHIAHRKMTASKEDMAVFAAILRGLGLLEDVKDADAIEEAMKRRKASLTAPSPSPYPWLPAKIPADRRVGSLSREESEEACFAFHANTAISRNTGWGIDCPDNPEQRYYLHSFEGCVAAFPRCDAPFRDVEACLRRTLEDPCRNSRAAADSCAALESCFWGMRVVHASR